MYAFFELYLVKGDPWDLLGRILWLAIPLFFWLPMAVLVGMLICSRIRTLRQFCVPAYYVSLSIVLFISAILLGPLGGGAGLYRLCGWSRGFILGGFFGLVTGGWVGWSVANQIKRTSAGLRKPFGVILHIGSGVLMFLLTYLPLALFADSFGGGSGQNSIFPGIANWFFWHLIDPWFFWIAWAFRILSHYGIPSVGFWIFVIYCLFDAGRRFSKVALLGDRKVLIRTAATGGLLIATTMILFFSVNEGKARPHITTACAALTAVEFGLPPSSASKAESYPTSYLDDERKTMNKYFEEWTATPIKDDPSFRVTSIAPDGTTEIEFISTGTKFKSKPGRPFACKEYGQEGLWLIEASYEEQTTRFARYICKD